jgi:hypothetical protein
MVKYKGEMITVFWTVKPYSLENVIATFRRNLLKIQDDADSGNMWDGYRNRDSRDLNVPITKVLSTSVPYFSSLALLFSPEDIGSTLLRKASKDLPNYKCHIFTSA